MICIDTATVALLKNIGSDGISVQPQFLPAGQCGNVHDTGITDAVFGTLFRYKFHATKSDAAFDAAGGMARLNISTKVELVVCGCIETTAQCCVEAMEMVVVAGNTARIITPTVLCSTDYCAGQCTAAAQAGVAVAFIVAAHAIRPVTGGGSAVVFIAWHPVAAAVGPTVCTAVIQAKFETVCVIFLADVPADVFGVCVFAIVGFEADVIPQKIFPVFLTQQVAVSCAENHIVVGYKISGDSMRPTTDLNGVTGVMAWLIETQHYGAQTVWCRNFKIRKTPGRGKTSGTDSIFGVKGDGVIHNQSSIRTGDFSFIGRSPLAIRILCNGPEEVTGVSNVHLGVCVGDGHGAGDLLPPVFGGLWVTQPDINAQVWCVFANSSECALVDGCLPTAAVPLTCGKSGFAGLIVRSVHPLNDGNAAAVQSG